MEWLTYHLRASEGVNPWFTQVSNPRAPSTFPHCVWGCAATLLAWLVAWGPAEHTGDGVEMLSQARPRKQYFYLRPRLNLLQRRGMTVK